MQLDPGRRRHRAGPDEPGSDRRVNLFLYRVEENAFLKNQDLRSARDPAISLSPPPLSLNLFYLLTVYAQNDAATGQRHGARDPRRGDAGASTSTRPCRAVTSPPACRRPRAAADRLQDARPGGAEPDLGDVRQAVPALGALPGVQPSSSTCWPRHRSPCRSASAQVGMPDVRARRPRRPSIDEMAPARRSGRHAAHLHAASTSPDGRSTVTLRRRPCSPTPPTRPATRSPRPCPPVCATGFYDVQVDVSAAFRRIFLFEVTP